MQAIRNDKPIFDAFRTLTGPITPGEFASMKAAIAAFSETGSDAELFAVFRKMDNDGRISAREFEFVKRSIAAAVANDDAIGVVQSETRDITDAAIESLKKTEGLRLKAYPDPGSRDGHPWTIGYGATGPGIRRGVVWTKAQADKRFLADIRRFEDQVDRILGSAPTTQGQYDAIVHFAYNIGTAALARSTFLKMHKRGDFKGAEAQFHRWVRNDGRVMRGLQRRRRIEASMYRGEHL